MYVKMRGEDIRKRGEKYLVSASQTCHNSSYNESVRKEIFIWFLRVIPVLFWDYLMTGTLLRTSGRADQVAWFSGSPGFFCWL